MYRSPLRFVERRPELRALEGWYDAGEYKFKLSCRFKDILRCSEFNGKTKHFTSCFSKGGIHWNQPERRCADPNWAIVYVPDKHGNFIGRAFVWWESTREGDRLVIDKLYGNKLKVEDIIMRLKNSIECRPSLTDTYLPAT